MDPIIKKIYNLAFDFCRFCLVIRFFHPRHNGQWPPTSKDPIKFEHTNMKQTKFLRVF